MSSWVATLNGTSSMVSSAMPSVVAGSHAEAVWSDAVLVRAHLSHEDLSGLLKSFTITTISEIGDKTFLTSAILAMRHSPVTVFWGSWTAMICMSTLSSLMGAVLPAILSKHGALWISAALFLGFGIVMLYHGWHMQDEDLGEEWKEAQDEIRADEEEHELDDMERGEPSPGVYPNVTPYPSVSGDASTLTRASQVLNATPKTSASVFLKEGTRNLCGLFFSAVFSQAFLLNFLGEWGDRSQITTMALAATHRVAIVAVGTSLAHMVCVAIAVTVGAILAARLSVRHRKYSMLTCLVTLGGACMFLVFGINSAYHAWNDLTS